MKKISIFFPLIIILVSLLLGVYFYDQMPEIMASHWNSQGEVDGYMPKFLALFLMPVISFGLFLLFLVIPKIDPLKKNIEKFRKHFDAFVILIISFLFYIYLLSIFWNLGWRFSMNLLLLPALAVLFYYCGILIANAKRNWFIGIRTPWTLSSEKVWDKTHKLGSKLFKLSAIIVLIGLFFNDYLFYFVLFPVVFSSVFTVIYSYFEYQKHVRAN